MQFIEPLEVVLRRLRAVQGVGDLDDAQVAEPLRSHCQSCESLALEHCSGGTAQSRYPFGEDGLDHFAVIVSINAMKAASAPVASGSSSTTAWSCSRQAVRIEVLDAHRNLGLHGVDGAAGAFPGARFAVMDSRRRSWCRTDSSYTEDHFDRWLKNTS